MQTGNQEGSPDAEATGESTTYDGLIGETIAGNFRLLKRIGSGTMGTVFQAEQISLGKMVAVKVMRSELMADTKLIKRFELEARAASALNHPNSIQIIDFGRHGNLLYIAMELLAGVDLAQVLAREWPLPLHRIGRIMDQVLAALDEAHAQGIVHRDLKPGNIMLVQRRGDPDIVKVLDFGIAKAGSGRERPNLTMKGFVFGTPEYMSPEQARGAETVDGRADLYAVSVILYQLIVGDIPFPAPSPVDILAKHLTEQPVPPSARGNIGIPQALEALILRGLAKRPDERPQTASEYRAELRQALGGVVAQWPGGSVPTPVMQSEPTPGPFVIASVPQRPPAGPAPAALAAAPATEPNGAPPTDILRRPSRLWIVFASAAVAMGAGFVLLSKDKVHRTEAFPFAALGPAPTSAAVALPAPTPVPPVLAPAPPAAVVATPLPEEPVAATTAPPERPRAEVVAKAAPKPRPPEREAKDRDRDKRGRKVAASEPQRHAAKPDAGRPASEPSGAVASAAAEAPGKDDGHAPPPPPSGPAEVMKEAERLLGQGEVTSACRKGEEVKRSTPRLATVHKFLGKCYMRSGRPEPAKESYRRYLELAPDASDAAFIKSFLK